MAVGALGADGAVTLSAGDAPVDCWLLPVALAMGDVDSAVAIAAAGGVVAPALVETEALEVSGAAPASVVALPVAGADADSVPPCPTPVWAALVVAVVSVFWAAAVGCDVLAGWPVVEAGAVATVAVAAPLAAVGCDELAGWLVVEESAVAAALPVAAAPFATVVPLATAGADPPLAAVVAAVEAALFDSMLAEESAAGEAAPVLVLTPVTTVDAVVPAVVAAESG